jgi:hypothetical protein
MRLALLLAAAVILIRDPTGKWAGDPLQPWFESLRNKLGLYCCAEADGHPLDDGEWDITDNKYRVFLQGEWTVVPDDAVLSGPNKFGKAIVWFRNPWGVTPTKARDARAFQKGHACPICIRRVALYSYPCIFFSRI